MNLAGKPEAMAKNIVRAMTETGVKKVILISSIGIYDEPLRPVLEPYRKAADVIEASALEYMILRPTWFTNAGEVDFEPTRKGTPKKAGDFSKKPRGADRGSYRIARKRRSRKPRRQ